MTLKTNLLIVPQRRNLTNRNNSFDSFSPTLEVEGKSLMQKLFSGNEAYSYSTNGFEDGFEILQKNLTDVDNDSNSEEFVSKRNSNKFFERSVWGLDLENLCNTSGQNQKLTLFFDSKKENLDNGKDDFDSSQTSLCDEELNTAADPNEFIKFQEDFTSDSDSDSISSFPDEEEGKKLDNIKKIQDSEEIFQMQLGNPNMFFGNLLVKPPTSKGFPDFFQMKSIIPDFGNTSFPSFFPNNLNQNSITPNGTFSVPFQFPFSFPNSTAKNSVPTTPFFPFFSKKMPIGFDTMNPNHINERKKEQGWMFFPIKSQPTSLNKTTTKQDQDIQKSNKTTDDAKNNFLQFTPFSNNKTSSNSITHRILTPNKDTGKIKPNSILNNQKKDELNDNKKKKEKNISEKKGKEDEKKMKDGKSITTEEEKTKKTKRKRGRKRKHSTSNSEESSEQKNNDQNEEFSPKKKKKKKYQHWTPEEDQLLKELVSKKLSWDQISRHLGNERSPATCRYRWRDFLNPELKKGPLTDEEKELILREKKKGKSLKDITSLLGQRPYCLVYNFYKRKDHSTIKKRGRPKKET